MKNISTAAVVAFFYILISFSIDLFSGDITFSSASISHLLIGYVIVFVWIGYTKLDNKNKVCKI